MPSSPPPPGRPGAPPRRGTGGLLGLLAVLAFVILAAVILTRPEPGTVAEVPPPPPVVAPTTTLAPPPSDVPPSTESAASVASAEPAAPAMDAPPPGQTARSSRRAGAERAAGGARVADSVPASGARGPGGLPPMGSSSRRFVLGTTSMESLKPVARDLKGFEPGGVGVKRAPEVDGRVELEMDPPRVRPGVDYTVKVYLANDGSKDIPVLEVQVSTVENGKSASRTTTPLAHIVKLRQRALLHEVSGVWRESARSWSMDVVVTSSRQDVYRNRLRWE